MNDKNKIILEISFNEEIGNYNIRVGSGMSVNECVFAISAFMRCLVRDNVVEGKQILLDLLSRYLNDPQFDELKPTEETENEKQEQQEQL